MKKDGRKGRRWEEVRREVGGGEGEKEEKEKKIEALLSLYYIPSTVFHLPYFN